MILLGVCFAELVSLVVVVLCLLILMIFLRVCLELLMLIGPSERLPYDYFV
jgi:hypothetical protein